MVGVFGPFAGANSDKSRAGGRSVGANEWLVGADGSRVEANAPGVRANGKLAGSHGRLEGTDGRVVRAYGLRVGTREPNVGLA